MTMNNELKCPLCKGPLTPSVYLYECTNCTCLLCHRPFPSETWQALASLRQPIPNGELESRLREAIISMNNDVSMKWFEGAIDDLIAAILPLVQAGGVNKRLLDAAKEFMEEVVIPQPNCSCFKHPPCSDCEKYGGLRELKTKLVAAIQSAEQAASSPRETECQHEFGGVLGGPCRKCGKNSFQLSTAGIAAEESGMKELERLAAEASKKLTSPRDTASDVRELATWVKNGCTSASSDPQYATKLADRVLAAPSAPVDGEVERLKFELKQERSNRCDYCGAKTIDRCQRCGAPQCCPQCCMIDDLRTKLADMTTDHDSERTQRKFLQGVRDDLSTRLADMTATVASVKFAISPIIYEPSGPLGDHVGWIVGKYKEATATVAKAKELAQLVKDEIESYGTDSSDKAWPLIDAILPPSQPTPPVETPPASSPPQDMLTKDERATVDAARSLDKSAMISANHSHCIAIIDKYLPRPKETT